ncbi:hypothetical protein ACPYIV_20180 [Parabacteroides sp. ASD2025]|uniref:hypothetical protein n=1 Tax=Parabacteroides sp. ASD2025 TaxID=3415987 RepID=UPI003CE928D0
MKCRKQISYPQAEDCQQCNFQDICKIESIICSADEISNIHTENTKSVLNGVESFNRKAERKMGGLWHIISTCAYAIITCLILHIVITLISYIFNFA